MRRNSVSVNALGFLAKPFEERGGVSDFTFRFAEGLALLKGHEAGQIVLIFHHEVEPAAKNGGALLGGFLAPGGEGAIGGFDGLAGFGAGEFWDGADDFAGGGIVHFERLAGRCLNPLTIDVTGFAEEAGIFELGSWALRFCGCRLHVQAPKF